MEESLDWTTADTAAAADLPSEQEGAAPDAGVLSDEVAAPPAADAGEKEETFFDPKELSEELQAEWKRMQAGFTRARQKDREQVRQAQEKVQLVDRLNSDPAFAKQLVEFLAPKVGIQLGGPPVLSPPAHQQANALADTVSQALADKLGPELAFLAPALAEAVQEATRAAVSPFEKRQVEQESMTRAQQQAARQAEEDRLMAELDAKLPNWEEEYGKKMEALDAFLASDTLVHPEFGSKYDLYLRLLNPDMARVAAIKDMERSSRLGITTGRTGTPTRSNVLDRVKEAHAKKGWNEMWDVIQSNPDAILDAMQQR